MEKTDFGGIKLNVDNLPSEEENRSRDTDKLSINEQKNKRFAQDTLHRKYLVYWMMVVVSVWLGLVLFILAFNKLFKFEISDQVLITLLATTTVNVLGLANIILKGLFGRYFSSKKK